MASKKWFWKGLQALNKRSPGSYGRFVSAYGACCTFADASVKRLVDALMLHPSQRASWVYRSSRTPSVPWSVSSLVNLPMAITPCF